MADATAWAYLSSGPREAVLERIIAENINVSGVYVTDPARWPRVRPTIALAERLRLPVHILRRADLAAPPPALRGAHCLSVGFGLILPPAFLAHIAVCLNAHATLLPKYAGARTLNWVIARGELESGVTVHIVDAGVDAGPIVLQRAFRLSPFETGRSLARKSRAFEPGVVVEALRKFEAEGIAAARPQDLVAGERLPDRTPAHSEIDPTRPLTELFDQIRAADADAYPAHFYVAGEKVCVKLWRPDKPADEADLV